MSPPRPRHAHPPVLALILPFLIAAGAAQATLVTGTVRDQDGVPVAAARVTFTPEDGGGSDIALTGADGAFELKLGASTAVTGHASGPGAAALYHNYPNPFNPTTIIPFEVSAAGPVRIEVYDALGQRVRTLVDAVLAPGRHQVRWDATDRSGHRVAAGVYLYRMTAGEVARTGKMVLVDGGGGARGRADAGAAASPAVSRTPAPKVLADAQPYNVQVTGGDFVPYERAGVPVVDGTHLDLVVNSTADGGMLRLGLTAAPASTAETVRLTIAEVEIRRGNADAWEAVGQMPRTVQLPAPPTGLADLLAERVLTSGPLTGLRVRLSAAQLTGAAGTTDLTLSDEARSGLVLAGDFQVPALGLLRLAIDLDLRRSVVDGGDGPVLAPALRLVDMATAGQIAGALVPGDGVDLTDVEAVVAERDGQPVTSAAPSADGHFRLERLPPGAYDLHLEAVSGIEPAAQTGVEVIAGEQTVVDVAVAAAGTELKRRVELGLTIPDAAYEVGEGSLTLTAEAVFLASIGATGGTALVTTGTLTQQGEGFTYAATPTDRLVIAWDEGAPTELTVSEFDGDFSDDAARFVRQDHVVTFAARRSGALDIEMSSRRLNGESAAELRGGIVVDGVSYQLDTRFSGTYASTVDGGSAEHESDERFTGTIVADNGFSATIDETHAFKLFVFESGIANRDRLAQNEWTLDGHTYTLDGFRLRYEELDGWPNPTDYWIAQGRVLEDGVVVGQVAMEDTEEWISVYIDIDGERVEIERFVKLQE